MEEYFQNNPKSGSFNQSNRGYPNVSLMALNMYIITSGRSSYVYGEISTPAFATMVSPKERTQSNSSTAFCTNSEGDSSCALGNICIRYPQSFLNSCAGLGFHAAKGWDPVTCLGSINFEAFLKILEHLREAEGIDQGEGESEGEEMRRSLRAR